MSFLCWSLGFLHSKPSSLLKTITCAISGNAFWDFYRSKPMIADSLRRVCSRGNWKRKTGNLLTHVPHGFYVKFKPSMLTSSTQRCRKHNTLRLQTSRLCLKRTVAPKDILWWVCQLYIRNFSIWHDLSCSLKRFLKRFAMPFALKSQNITYQRSVPCRLSHNLTISIPGSKNNN